MRSAKVVFMCNQAKQVKESGGKFWSTLAPLRRGGGSKQPYDVPTPALFDKDGSALDTMPAMKERRVWHVAEVEGGVPTSACGIVHLFLFAAASRAGMSDDGDFTCLPTLAGIRNSIAGTRPRSAPGPDGVGPGIDRRQTASTWSAGQIHVFAVTQTCTLKSHLQSRFVLFVDEICNSG